MLFDRRGKDLMYKCFKVAKKILKTSESEDQYLIICALALWPQEPREIVFCFFQKELVFTKHRQKIQVLCHTTFVSNRLSEVCSETGFHVHPAHLPQPRLAPQPRRSDPNSVIETASICDRFGVDSRSIQGQSGVDSRSSQVRFGIDSGSVRG